MLCWKCHSSSYSLCRPQSSPSPQRCKGYQTHNSPYSRWCRIRRSRSPSAAKHLPVAVRPTATRYEPLPSTVDDRDITEAPFFVGRLPYCRPKPSPRRPVSYTSPVCVEQNYRSATTWRMGKSERRPFICCRNNVATVIRAAVCIAHDTTPYPRSPPTIAVRPVQHPAALCLTRRPPPLHPCIFSPLLLQSPPPVDERRRPAVNYLR